MAKILNKDPATYQKERDVFIQELQHFHETRGTPSRKMPKINGQEIDLYLLYNLVTSRGGWLKVNSRNEWDLILENFKVPKHCVNSAVALKQVYLRYLDRYEKVHYLGEVGERASDDDEDSRHRRWSARALHSVPLTYNYHQHNVNESLRHYNGLSTELYRNSEYDRLALSLMSPLPNEQDFAINVCTLLSNEGKHILKLERHPRILHFLLAHAAVFDHSSMRELFIENYSRVRGHSMSHFWPDVLLETDLLQLLDENKFVKKVVRKPKADSEDAEKGKENKQETIQMDESGGDNEVVLCNGDDSGVGGGSNDGVGDGSGSSSSSISISTSTSSDRLGLKLEPEDRELFCLGRTLGTQDYIGQRVLQIATILRNLTFTEENILVMAKDITFIRFVLLCCGARWNSLHQLGFDMLTNIAGEMLLTDQFVDIILSLVTKGLESCDRAVVLSCIEVLNKLGQNEKNEETLLRCVEEKDVRVLVTELAAVRFDQQAMVDLVYERVCSFLSLHDIMLLVHTLECLYSMSSLGERACNAIVRVHGALDTLVSLITVEAQSYGPKACILMRVVETVTSGVSTTATTTQPSTVSTPATTTTTQHSTLTLSNVTAPLPALPTPAVARPVATPSPGPIAPLPPVATPAPSPSVITVQPAPQRVVVTPNTSHATQQVAQENEQFALAWLRASYEPVSGGRVEQGELYKQYLNSCAKIGRRGVIAPLHFPRCVRSVFGGSIGPKSVTIGDTTQQVYEGIQVRGKSPLPTPLTPASPILKAQLSAPPKPTPNPSKKETKSKVSTHPHLSQALLGSGGGSGSPPPAAPAAPTPPIDGSVVAGSSSLIKSLLASKVCELVPTHTTSMPTAINQVTQRQQQQRLLQAQQQPNKSPVPVPAIVTATVTAIATATSTITVTVTPTVTVTAMATVTPTVTVTVTPTTTPNMNTKTIKTQTTACRINGARTNFQQIELAIDPKMLVESLENSDGLVSTSTQANIENHVGTGPPPPPLAPLSGGIPRFPMPNKQTKLDIEDSDSTGNNSIASSSGIRDNCSATGGEEGDNSLTSFESFLLNGVPSSLDVDDTTSKDSAPKSLMLADLLEKTIEKKEPPVLNGALRIGEKGLELVQGPGIIKSEIKCELVKNDGNIKKSERGDQVNPLKRPPSKENGCETEAKRPHMNGDASSEEPPEEGNVSSTAANLYAALAADTLEDETDDLVEPPAPPQQLIVTTAAPRQILVAAGGQIALPQRMAALVQPHYVVAAQPQTALVQGQTQTVLVAQTAQQQGTGAKTIIILQPQQVAAPTPPPPPPPPPTHQKVIVQRLQSPPPQPPTPVGAAVKVVRPPTPTQTPPPPAPTPTPAPSPAPTLQKPTPPPPPQPPTIIKSQQQQVQQIRTEPQGHFLCEWRGCMRNFKSANEVYMHACESHCPSGSNEMQCLWERCDAMKRKRFSLMTHLYDRHCNADVLRMMAVRRKQLSVSGRSEIPAPTPPTPHPGYAPNAAFHAIKRHALEFVNPKELQQRAVKPGPTPTPVPIDQDDNEGPVTKSIRLTAALILRNLVIYSTSGRRYLTSYESHLASVALSNVESSRTIAQVLFDMSQPR